MSGGGSYTELLHLVGNGGAWKEHDWLMSATNLTQKKNLKSVGYIAISENGYILFIHLFVSILRSRGKFRQLLIIIAAINNNISRNNSKNKTSESEKQSHKM